MNRVVSRYKTVSANTDARGPHALQRPTPYHHSFTIGVTFSQAVDLLLELLPMRHKMGHRNPMDGGYQIGSAATTGISKGGLGVIVECKQTNTQEQVHVLGYIIW